MREPVAEPTVLTARQKIYARSDQPQRQLLRGRDRDDFSGHLSVLQLRQRNVRTHETCQPPK